MLRIWAPLKLFIATLLLSSVAFGHGSHGPDLTEHKNNPEYKKALAHREDLIKLSSEMHAQSMKMASDLQLLPKTGYIERDFAQLLIQQHQAAAEMAELGLKYGKNSELRGIAEKISEQRRSDIQKLKEWLRDHRNISPR